jgi:chemotaxis signal transduction protein
MDRLASTTSVVSLYAVVSIDDCKLLLPQQEINSLESILDSTTTPQEPPAIGAFTLDGESWPVFCLSSELAVLLAIPNTRRMCVLLKDGNHAFGLACDQIEPLRQQNMQLQPLPACMKTATSPVQALVLHGDAVGCVTTTARLANLIAGFKHQENSHAF